MKNTCNLWLKWNLRFIILTTTKTTIYILIKFDYFVSELSAWKWVSNELSPILSRVTWSDRCDSSDDESFVLEMPVSGLFSWSESTELLFIFTIDLPVVVATICLGTSDDSVSSFDAVSRVVIWLLTMGGDIIWASSSAVSSATVHDVLIIVLPCQIQWKVIYQ